MTVICSSDQLSFKLQNETSYLVTSFPNLQTEKINIYIHQYSSTLSYISQMCKIKQNVYCSQIKQDLK